MLQNIFKYDLNMCLSFILQSLCNQVITQRHDLCFFWGEISSFALKKQSSQTTMARSWSKAFLISRDRLTLTSQWGMSEWLLFNTNWGTCHSEHQLLLDEMIMICFLTYLQSGLTLYSAISQQSTDRHAPLRHIIRTPS